MKKLFALVALALTTLSLSAQDSNFELYAGLGMSNVTGDTDGWGVKSIFNYKVGAAYDLGLGDTFTIIPAAEIAYKGWKQDGIDGDLKMMYLQVPVHAALKFEVATDLNLVVKAGPYASYGLLSTEIDWGEGEKSHVFDDFKRLDFGLSTGLGVEAGQYTIGVEFSRGFANIADDDYDGKVFNQTFGLTVGFKF